MDYEIYDPRMRDLILTGGDLKRVFGGMLWAEGPVYFPAGDYFLWSDIPGNRLYQWPTDSTVRVFTHASDYTNGNTRDRQGRLVSCRHQSRSVVRSEPDGSETVIASSYGGKRLNSPNDVIVSRSGAIWFTDPTYGILTNYEGTRAEPEQPFCGVYRVSAEGGAVEAVVTRLQKPNGLALSLDETELYVADSARSHDIDGNHHVFSFALRDGRPGEPRPLFEIEHGVPDGLRVDEYGHIWCSSARGVEVFDGNGTHIGCIKIPETVANLEFGGRKGNRLLIAAKTSTYALYVAVSGAGFSPPIAG